MYYPDLTQKKIDDHAAWYESIVIVDEQGNPLEPVFTDDPAYDDDREKKHDQTITICAT